MLTIVVTAYNHEKYIQACLEGCLGVNVQGLKIIVIDDGSTDKTSTVVKDFIQRNSSESKIQLIEKPNQGLISSLLLVVPLINSPYVYFTASDDVPIPRGIENLLDEFSTSNAPFIMGGAENLFEDGSTNKVYSTKHERFFSLSATEQFKQLFINCPQPLLFQSSIFKTDAIRAVGGWDADVMLDDYSMFIKLFGYSLEKGVRPIFKPDVIVCLYRHHGTNSYKNSFRQFQMVKQVLEKKAPANLLPIAMGNMTAYYLLNCIRRGSIDTAFKILKHLNIRYYGSTLKGSVGWLLGKINKK
jgi:glycosyltransferase involved in cell wall biosynthesis